MEERITSEDLGFKVFKLAAPHIRPWSNEGSRDADDYAAKLTMFNDPLVPGWTPEGILWEVALREGYSLNTRYEINVLSNSSTVWEVTDPDSGQSFTVCLDDTVKADLSRVYELTPDRLLVCRDKALDDTAAANLALQCRLKTI
jgi:adenine-specific DNA-methyltransferase